MDLKPIIEQAAADPASATTDGQSATSHSLPDLIEADKYLSAKAAAGIVGPTGKRRSGLAGMRPATLTPPGAV